MRRPSWFAAFVLVLAGTSSASAQGPVLAGAGPINRSMGGASTAAPLDATGTLYWNPAAIGGLAGNELDLAAELLYPRSTIASSIPGGVLGPGIPPGSVYGKTHDEAGVFALPSGGFVYRPECSDWTFGVGLFPSAGFGVNYPGDPTNPILSASPPNGFGFGPASSNYQLFQIAPTAAYRVTDKLFVGFSPLIDMARLAVAPGLFVPPGNANGDAVTTIPAATSTRSAFGAGFQLGVYYVASDSWRFGASFKSPQWFEPFRYNVADELGRGQTVRFRFESPLIVSVGTSYTGIDRLTVAADLRYLNFKDMAGVRNAGFAPTGEVYGLGWRDVASAALGAQYRLSDKVSVRAGYTYNTPLIPGRNVLLNAAAPLTYQHQLAVGASYRLTEACVLSAGYYHIFYDTVTGPYLTPGGPIPGARVTTGTTVDSVLVGASVRF